MKVDIKNVMAALAMASSICVYADNGTPRLGVATVDEVVAAMTLEEKARFLIGAGMSDAYDEGNGVVGHTKNIVPGAAGTTWPIPRLGIPAIVFADGPAGVRIDPTRESDSTAYNCTHFPMGTLLGATWNDSLVTRVGHAIGNEALEYGIDIMLAPALNIQRHPLCGRNYEYYSEDPVLSGHIAAAYTRGIQQNGVGACVKHLAANNQETNRKANESIVSQRALREIYLKGFEHAIKEVNPWTVMSSYNYLNGMYTSENPELLDSLLRREWAYDGVVVSDWFGGTDAVAQMKAGNELLQPGYEREYTDILDALKNGTLDEKVMDRNITRVLNLIMRTPRFSNYRYSNRPDIEAHAELCREAAPEGMVLLKNSGSTLPLKSSVKSVALFGNNSYDLIAGGTGSGDVNRAYNVNLCDGLTNRGFAVNGNIATKYQKHIDKEYKRLAHEDKTFWMAVRQRPAELRVSPGEIARAAKEDDMAIITVGFGAGEFSDRSSSSFYLNDVIADMLHRVCDEFHKQGKSVIVVLNTGGVIETASWKELPDAILCAWQSGQEGGNSIVDILTGDAFPSGKLPMTFPVDYADHASNHNFPVDVDGGIIFGANTRKHSRDKRNIDYTVYEEDIYVGYRYFDSFGVEVSYPFGYGLSYTDFEYADLNVVNDGNRYTATVVVKNVGKYHGKEIAQLYYSAPLNVERPVKELLAYAKTRTLAPGESDTLTFRFTPRELAFFDERQSAWLTPDGQYMLYIGSSSRDIRDMAPLSVESELLWPVNNILAPSQKIERLKP
ncbi:MAG: beta-glucosidase [Muribaculaceae bacterium]|nr:beta-glucosidase [Muribaculaceae bacterium]